MFFDFQLNFLWLALTSFLDIGILISVISQVVVRHLHLLVPVDSVPVTWALIVFSVAVISKSEKC